MKKIIDFVEVLKTGEYTSNRGWSKEKKITDNLKIIIRKDFDKYAHPVDGIIVNHYNIEIQELNVRRKWKKKECFHIVYNYSTSNWECC